MFQVVQEVGFDLGRWQSRNARHRALELRVTLSSKYHRPWFDCIFLWNIQTARMLVKAHFVFGADVNHIALYSIIHNTWFRREQGSYLRSSWRLIQYVIRCVWLHVSAISSPRFLVSVSIDTWVQAFQYTINKRNDCD
jgi:hypothetical protein